MIIITIIVVVRRCGISSLFLSFSLSLAIVVVDVLLKYAKGKSKARLTVFHITRRADFFSDNSLYVIFFYCSLASGRYYYARILLSGLKPLRLFAFEKQKKEK